MAEEPRENGVRLEPERRESEAEGTLIFPALEAGCHKRDEAEATTDVDKPSEAAIEFFLFFSYLLPS